MEKGREKRIISVLMVLTIIFTLMGGTLSYLRWQTSEEQKTNVVFMVNENFSCAADGGGNIESASLMPASCTNEKYAIQREVVVTSAIKGNGMAIAMDLWLDINELGRGLSQSEHFRYALTTVENDCTTGIVTEGRFTGLSSENNDKVMLLNGQKYTTSKSDKYYLYIWIDPLEENDYIVDQSFNFSLGGGCSELYTVNYDLNGGEGTIVNQYKASNEVITLSNEIPTRAGYTFVGWSSSPTAITAQYKPGEEYILDKNMTLYAVWNVSSPVESYSCGNGSVGSEPYAITYTGNCEVIDDGDGDWRVKFLTNGEFKSNGNITIDVFLVGGGGRGGNGGIHGGGGGGGGGYTVTSKAIELDKDNVYEIVVGAGGENTTAFAITASAGANGGAGGTGSVYGTGGSGTGRGGNGTTCCGTGGRGGAGGFEFNETSGTYYGGGGGGGGGQLTDSWSSGGAGGSGGGGKGGGPKSSGSNGSENTGGGGGGGGAQYGGGKGGSGIVIIRNSQTGCRFGDNVQFEENFKYTGNCEIIDDGDANWRIKFLTSGNFVIYDTYSFENGIDVFLVGGGGGGGNGGIHGGGGGGGGGYTVTSKAIELEKDNVYEIVVGAGGQDTTAFGITASAGANGGAGGTGSVYGYGGSGTGSGGNGTTCCDTGGRGGVGAFEFNEISGTYYGGGGGGGGGQLTDSWSSGGAGGSGGGGKGGGPKSSGSNGSENTGGGGGGGGAQYGGGKGGSGIAMIRNKR